MIQISKEIAHRLHKEYGVCFRDGGISRTYTKCPKYYLCESRYNLDAFKKLTKTK